MGPMKNNEEKDIDREWSNRFGRVFLPVSPELVGFCLV